MITDIFFLLVASIVQIVAFVLGGINFVITAPFSASITTAVGSLNYFKGVFNIVVLGQCIGLFFTFLEFWYGAKLFLWVLHFIPLIRSRGQFHGVKR
jgi:hypothetical protein